MHSQAVIARNRASVALQAVPKDWRMTCIAHLRFFDFPGGLEVLEFFSSPEFRRVLHECCPDVAELPSQELLERRLAEPAHLVNPPTFFS